LQRFIASLAWDVLQLVSHGSRPQVPEAMKRCKQRLRTRSQRQTALKTGA